MRYSELAEAEVKEAIEAHIKLLGPLHLEVSMRQTMEESAELTVKLLHWWRGRAKRPDIVEELADLYICMEFLIDAMNIDPADVEKMIIEKSRRFCERAKNGGLNATEEDVPEFERVAGDAVCKKCNRTYFEHSEHPRIKWLRMLCDGSFVKL